MAPRGVCPACGQRVEFWRTDVDTFKCRNCHAVCARKEIPEFVGFTSTVEMVEQPRQITEGKEKSK